MADTKKIIDPRVEIDTSPPFESVKEAVDRFGGSGPWIPNHLLRLAAAHHNNEAVDVERLEEEAVQLERDLIMKEQQTLNVMKELEAAKRLVEGLKVNLVSPAGLMLRELNEAKMNLSKTSVDLAAIQASVESLNNKLRKDKILVGRESKMQIQMNPQGGENHGNGTFEAEQFKKMTEASRYEVMKAMTEIERTKNCIRMAEMRLNAAKKMEEAAKAVEAIALAQRNAENPSHTQESDGITLSFQEYQALSHKAKQAEELCNTKFIDTMDVPVLEKFEQTTTTTTQNKETNFVIEHGRSGHKFRNRNAPDIHEMPSPPPGFRSTTSIGDVLSRKVVVQDDVMVGRQHVSLSQMLKEQSRLILHPNKTSNAEPNVQKQYFMHRKKFGFIQVPIPTKQTKKKPHPTS